MSATVKFLDAFRNESYRNDHILSPRLHHCTSVCLSVYVHIEQHRDVPASNPQLGLDVLTEVFADFLSPSS
jgi:hypothetical protein